jgi:hypothetical protein
LIAPPNDASNPLHRTGKIIVLGGANCEGVMGQEPQRQFAWIDFVVSGEGDLTFPDLVKPRVSTTELYTQLGRRTADSWKASLGAKETGWKPMLHWSSGLPSDLSEPSWELSPCTWSSAAMALM